MLQWRILGRGPAPSPLFFRPNETIFLGDRASPLIQGSGWPLPPPPPPHPPATLISRSRRGTVLFFNKLFLLFLPSALQIRFRYQGYLEGFFTIQQIGMCDVVICLYGQTSGKRPHKLRRVSGRLRQVVAYDSPTAGGFFFEERSGLTQYPPHFEENQENLMRECIAYNFQVKVHFHWF